jgi:lipid II:glycine glycyltransferase (peptidoglycan interpeptide bridge formation enzyme)
MYTIKEVTDRSTWDTLTRGVLLQAWNWGEFQKEIGHKVYRLGVYRANDLIGGAQVIQIKSALRSHLYVPNGPVVFDQHHFVVDARLNLEVTESILQYIRKTLTSLNTHYIRFDPLIIESPENNRLLHELGLLQGATFVQPEHTILLDLRKTEEELLTAMSKTTRYDIKRGQKDGIRITSSVEASDFDIFWKMFYETVKRQKFVAYSKSYYQKQLECLKENGNYKIYIAYDAETPLAAALVASDEGCSYYLHAGRAQSKLDGAKYAPKVLLWQAIIDAKERGKRRFNLYGIAKNDEDPNDPWYGLSAFKKSFGGYTLSYVGSLDFPVTVQYWLIRLFEKTRRLWGYPYFLVKQLLGR